MSHPYETDSMRQTRLLLAHRKALQDLQRVTLRYQVHNELVELAAARRLAALDLVVRASLVCLLFALAACGGGSFDASAAVDGVPTKAIQDASPADVLELFQVDAGDVPDVPTKAIQDASPADVLELRQVDAGDAGDAAPSSVYLDAGDVDARACVVITGYTCAVAGYPYPARCDSLPCCCATP